MTKMITGKLKDGYGTVQRDVMQSDMSIQAKAVYALLISYTGEKNYCFPSINTICKDLKTSKPKIIDCLRELRENNFLKISKRKNENGGYNSNIYQPLHIWEEIKDISEVEGVVNEIDYPSNQELLPLVNEVYPKINNYKINKEDKQSKIDIAELPSATTAVELNDSEKCRLFIEKFNELKVVNGKKGKYQAIPSICGSLKQRLKNYKTADIFRALKIAMADDYHIKTKFKYITPEYMLRPNILERFLNTEESEEESTPSKRALVY